MVIRAALDGDQTYSDGGLGDACGGLLGSIALALELEHRDAILETVKEGSAHGGVAVVLTSVLHDAIGNDDRTVAPPGAQVHISCPIASCEAAVRRCDRSDVTAAA